MRRLLILCAFACACKERAKEEAPKVTTAPPPAPTPTPGSESAMPPAPSMIAEKTSIVRGANRFALALWANAGAGNVALSPASISTALTITWGGAKGETAAQMQKVLGFEGRPDVVLSLAGSMYKSLQAPTLKLANRLYGERSYEIDTTYFNVIRKAFDVWIEPVDFAHDPEGVRGKINGWVAEQTEQRIKDLLPPRAVDAETRVIIVNAIYFLADWAHPFDVKRTQPRDFFVDGKEARKVPTMVQTEALRYATDKGAALVELPYKDGKTSMYVLLPDARDGLAAVEKTLESTLKDLQGRLADTRVELSLPRFVIDPPAPLDLAKQLQTMGIVDAFSADKADFSGIAKPKSPADKLFIGAVFHKAFVKVDEKGTEAAAATAVAMPRGGAALPKPTAFTADHPFLFVIADKPSGQILFIGRVTDPT